MLCNVGATKLARPRPAIIISQSGIQKYSPEHFSILDCVNIGIDIEADIRNIAQADTLAQVQSSNRLFDIVKSSMKRAITTAIVNVDLSRLGFSLQNNSNNAGTTKTGSNANA
jgi:hypothetical protein